jgi:hypothetical protein
MGTRGNVVFQNDALRCASWSARQTLKTTPLGLRVGRRPRVLDRKAQPFGLVGGYLVDPASSHMLV